ncbi:hypothetical protein, partial [Burkholderia contaminans]|uniref:hypothetical protein n=1 Tax=Burkholderia contaminans TaxID=488447 RepID=UPI001C2E730D
WKPDSLGFHWRTAAFNLQLRLGHCPKIGSELRSLRANVAPICIYDNGSRCFTPSGEKNIREAD